jgi:hypothetical protein
MTDKLYDACRDGNLDRVNQMISRGETDWEETDWNWGLIGACWSGHLVLVILMIEHGATDWNRGLYYACQGGHLDLANLMINRGATSWNLGLEGACHGGHLELANMMINQGADDWDRGLYGSCWGEHIELTKYLIRCILKRKIEVDISSRYKYLEIEVREEITRDLLNCALVRDRILGLGPEFDVIDKYLF